MEQGIKKNTKNIPKLKDSGIHIKRAKAALRTTNHAVVHLILM